MVYLLPTEVSLSLWFFFLLFRLVRVVRVMAVNGVVTSPRLGVEVETVDGPALQIRDGERSTNV
jgi:hypothetical protein